MLFKKYPNALVALILLVFFLVSTLVSSQESTTMDEQAHIPSGYSYVRYGDMRLNPEHPPLLKDLAGLPLLFVNPFFPITDSAWTNGNNAQWLLGNKLLHDYGNNADAITFWSRVPIILVAVLLGIFIYIWTRELAGTGAGLFALTLYAFDPNVLGHNHYVTTDIGIAAFIFISTYFFVRFLKLPTARNILLAGLFLGLAQLAKFSAVLVFPIFGLMTLAYALAKTLQPNERPSTSPQTRRSLVVFDYLWKFAVVVIVCFVTIWILYFFNTLNMPAEKIRAISDSVFTANNGAAHIARATVDWMSDVPGLKGLSEYFLGVFMVFARVAGGNTYYFLGTVSNHATPWYFPTAFLLKETLPFLFLLLCSLGYVLVRAYQTLSQSTVSFRQTLATFIEERAASITMVGFIALYIYLSATGNLNIGFRHLFPILPFLYLLVAKIMADALRRLRANCGTIGATMTAIVVSIFSFWIVAIPVLAFPSYLSYYNEITGGPQNGYRYITDSNYDWGQDLKRLRNWVNTYNAGCDSDKATTGNCQYISKGKPIDTIRIDYFGGSNPQYYFGDNFIPWHADLAPQPGWYAISAGFYQESIHKTDNLNSWNYRWLTNYPMIDRAGDSIFIFYIPNPPHEIQQ